MNIDPQTGKNYGLPPTAEDVRNFAAELDDRDEATQEELDMLRHIAERLEVLEKERDEARREICNATAHPDMEAHERGWDCFKDNP